MRHLKRLIAAFAVVGMVLAFTALPASATPLSYAVYHCRQIQQTVFVDWPAYWHQVNLLAGPQTAGGSQLVHLVHADAHALQLHNSPMNRQLLGGACSSLPGMPDPGGH